MNDYTASWLASRMTEEMETPCRVYIDRNIAYRGIDVCFAVKLLGNIQYSWSKMFTEEAWTRISEPAVHVADYERVPEPDRGISIESLVQEAAGHFRSAIRGIATNPEVKALGARVNVLSSETASLSQIMRMADADLKNQLDALTNKKPWWRLFKRKH